MGAGASASERRIFCHHCGSRTVPADGNLRCSICGSTEGVEATDARLPVTEITGSSPVAASSPLGSGMGSGSAVSALAPATLGGSEEDQVMRVESITVTAEPRPSEGNMVLRVVPHVTYRSRSQHEAAEQDVIPRPVCSEILERLEVRKLEAPVESSGPLYDPCVICGSEIEEHDLVVELQCSHVFHEECIRKWLAQQHTCPFCRFELEEDNAKYLRSIGLREEAEAIEEVEQMRRDCERQKQQAERRRWMRSLRQGEPVHFGLTCQQCEVTPLVGICYRCQVCEQFVLCTDCYPSRDSLPGTPGGHVPEHPFAPVHGSNSGAGGWGTGATSTLTFSVAATSSAPSQQPPPDDTAQSDAALAAAEAAFMAVRSLALAPVGVAATPRSDEDMSPSSAADGARSLRETRETRGHRAVEIRARSAEGDRSTEGRGRTRHRSAHTRRTRSAVHRQQVGSTVHSRGSETRSQQPADPVTARQRKSGEQRRSASSAD